LKVGSITLIENRHPPQIGGGCFSPRKALWLSTAALRNVTLSAHGTNDRWPHDVDDTEKGENYAAALDMLYVAIGLGLLAGTFTPTTVSAHYYYYKHHHRHHHHHHHCWWHNHHRHCRWWY
jgi:hypothetical protein